MIIVFFLRLFEGNWFGSVMLVFCLKMFVKIEVLIAVLFMKICCFHTVLMQVIIDCTS